MKKMRTLKFLELEERRNREDEQMYFCAHSDCSPSAFATTRIVLTKSAGRTFIFYLCEQHSEPYLERAIHRGDEKKLSG